MRSPEWGNAGLAEFALPPRRIAMVDGIESEELLTPAEVASMFRVNPKTVTRWARAGRISYIKTLGGHRRFKASEIRRLVADASH